MQENVHDSKLGAISTSHSAASKPKRNKSNPREVEHPIFTHFFLVPKVVNPTQGTFFGAFYHALKLFNIALPPPKSTNQHAQSGRSLRSHWPKLP